MRWRAHYGATASTALFEDADEKGELAALDTSTIDTILVNRFTQKQQATTKTTNNHGKDSLYLSLCTILVTTF